MTPNKFSIIPAIDIRDGKVVRLTRGDYDRQTVYAEDPLELARRFYADGARRIHMVDLEAARSGKPSQMDLIRSVAAGVDAECQVGGGIRDARTIEQYLSGGLKRVIVGTRACLDRGFLKETLSAFGKSVIIGIDAVGGKVAVDGWTKVTETRTDELIDDALKHGAGEFICTDIDTDGMLKGPNVRELDRLCGAFPEAGIIASGGVSGAQDVKALAGLKRANLTGVIIGKAIYEGRLTVKEAISAC